MSLTVALVLALAPTSERNQITVDEVVSELKRHAVGAKRDMVTMRGLQLLGQHLSMFKDKVEHGADFSLLDALRRIEAKKDAARGDRGEAGARANAMSLRMGNDADARVRADARVSDP